MRLAKVRLIVTLVIAVAIMIFVLFSTKKTDVEFGGFWGVKPVHARVVIFLSLALGLVLGYLFRLPSFFRKKASKKPQK